MLPIFIRDCTPALNSLMKTPSAVCICEPVAMRMSSDHLAGPYAPWMEIQLYPKALMQVSMFLAGVPAGVAGSSQQGRY